MKNYDEQNSRSCKTIPEENKAEAAKIHEYSLALAYLQDHGVVTDTQSVKSVIEFFSYFCNKYSGYSYLPEEVKLTFDVVYFSDPSSFMSTAYTKSSCVTDFEVL